MKSKYLTYIVLILLCVSCVKKEATQEAMPVPVKTAQATTSDVPIYIQTVGHIQAWNTVNIQSQVTGVLTNAYFEQGQSVNKGDLLLTIDDRPYRAALEKAEAQLEQMLAQLKYSQDNTKRNTPLVEDEYISKDNYESLVTSVLVNEGAVKEQMAIVEQAKIDLGYCFIYAPMDAVTGNRNFDPGNLLLEESADTVVTLQQVKPIETAFFLSEKDLPKVQKLFRQTTLAVEVSYDQQFTDKQTGDLHFIDNTVNESTGLIRVKGILPNEDEMLWPGEYVNVRLILETQKDAILIPVEAVLTEVKGKFVYVIKKDSTAEKRTVEIGQREKDNFIITKGLKSGETVVTEGQFNLITGTKVSIKQ